jgi:hypothetical protein
MPTGLSSPAYREWLDYVIVENGQDVGRLYEDGHAKAELRWFWSITVYVNPMRGIVAVQKFELDEHQSRRLMVRERFN